MMNLINRIGKCAIPVSVLTMMPLMASASTNLRADDFVGISFWIISIAMVAATIFFFMESNKVDAKWSTSLTVAGLVTLVAAVHYFYMRGVWVETQDTPTVYRYVDSVSYTHLTLPTILLV